MYDLDNIKIDVANVTQFPASNIDLANDSIELMISKLKSFSETSKSVFDSNTTARGNEFNALVTQLQTIANALETTINNEVIRATGAENTNALAITAEQQARVSALETINATLTQVQNTQTSATTAITDRLDIIQGTSETAGSINYAIKQLVGGAPELMDTLEKLRVAFETADGSLLDTFASQLTALKGTASSTSDTLGELENTITANKSELEGSISTVDGKVTTLTTSVNEKDSATNSRIDLLVTDVNNKNTDVNNKIDLNKTALEGAIAVVQTDVNSKNSAMTSYVDTKTAENKTVIDQHSVDIGSLQTSVSAHAVSLSELATNLTSSTDTLRTEFQNADTALRTILDTDIGQVSGILTKVKTMLDDETDGEVISVIESLQGIVDELNSRDGNIKGTATIINGEIVITHNLGTSQGIAITDWEAVAVLTAFAPALVYVEKVNANSFKIKATDLRYFASAAKPMTDPVSVSWNVTYKPKKYTSTITKSGLNETATIGSQS